jgi:hypothetical protein
MRKKSGNVIFTPLDPRWDDFTSSLCFHLNIHDGYDGEPVSTCDGSFRLSRNILENRYPDVDVEKTLEYFKTMDSFCDCEVFFECPCGLGIDQQEHAMNVDVKVK